MDVADDQRIKGEHARAMQHEHCEQEQPQHWIAQFRKVQQARDGQHRQEKR